MRSLPHRQFLALLAENQWTPSRLTNEKPELLHQLLADGEVHLEVGDREITLFLFLAEKSPPATEPLVPFQPES